MTVIPIPKNYGSFEELSNWLKRSLPHEWNIDGGPRWTIMQHVGGNWYIQFARGQDATFFNLIWPH